MSSLDSTPMTSIPRVSSITVRSLHLRAISLVVIAALLGASAACRGKAGGARDTAAAVPAAPSATSSDTAGGAITGAVPPSVEALGRHAENAYDMANVGDWARARASADSLRLALDSIPGSAVAVGASREDVTTAFGDLNLAITRKDRSAARRASNRLTELGALLSESYDPQVPPQVTLLDYYGRELEIWAAAGDRAKLRETASAMRRTWDAVRPRVEARGGATEAANFETLVAQVEAATTPAEYSRLATPVLDAVDTLEQVFIR